jgi:translation elongation factor aEF-1 beta
MKLNVAVTLRITPADIKTDLSIIQKELVKATEVYGKVHSSEIKPIAFGLNCVEAVLLLDDSKGGIDEIESAMKKSKDVGEIDVLDVGRL